MGPGEGIGKTGSDEQLRGEGGNEPSHMSPPRRHLLKKVSGSMHIDNRQRHLDKADVSEQPDRVGKRRRGRFIVGTNVCGDTVTANLGVLTARVDGCGS